MSDEKKPEYHGLLPSQIQMGYADIYDKSRKIRARQERRDLIVAVVLSIVVVLCIAGISAGVFILVNGHI